MNTKFIVTNRLSLIPYIYSTIKRAYKFQYLATPLPNCRYPAVCRMCLSNVFSFPWVVGRVGVRMFSNALFSEVL